jgi:hypothetical protein
MTRKLSLKRDVLQELSSDELTGVAAGTKTTIDTKTLLDTMYSCLTYQSCACVITRDPACW